MRTVYDEPRVCSSCGESGPWLIEDMEGDGRMSLAHSCDEHLAEVLREYAGDVQPMVSELFAEPVALPDETRICEHPDSCRSWADCGGPCQPEKGPDVE